MNSERAEIRDELLAMGIETVRAEYSGSDDEGFIDNIDFAPVSPTQPMRRDIDDFLWDTLQTGRFEGFHNNDGGYGTFTWDLVNDKLVQQHNDYYTAETNYPEEEIE